jgi:predicted RNase H-like nuclease
MATYVGVDWSSGAWLAVAFDADGYEETNVFEEIGDLWYHYEETADRILIDIPIGLIEEGSTGRACDKLARDAVGSRGVSVFTPPVREATRKRRYPAAKRVHERKTGASLTKQAFGLSDSIAAVDDLVRNVPEARMALRESHPEVCFRAMAGETLQYSKKTAAGYAERMRTLAGFDSDAPPVVQAVAEATGGHDVAVDDVLDALVLAYTARPGPGKLRSLPSDPPTDAKGLAMEIVYRSRTPLTA